jgi:hypothetical protein
MRLAYRSRKFQRRSWIRDKSPRRESSICETDPVIPAVSPAILTLLSSNGSVGDDRLRTRN